jgi:hypothetical protein
MRKQESGLEWKKTQGKLRPDGVLTKEGEIVRLVEIKCPFKQISLPTILRRSRKQLDKYMRIGAKIGVEIDFVIWFPRSMHIITY